MTVSSEQEAVREAFPQLSGIDQLSKLFKTPIDAFAGRVSSRSPIPQSIWAFPGHILVSLSEGSKLLAFDFLAKPKLGPDAVDLLALNVNDKEGLTSVISVLQTQANSTLLYIVLKSGDVLTTKFNCSIGEWIYQNRLSLCKGKRSQVISVCYSSTTEEIFWCEKRSPTQCCVCKSRVGILKGSPFIEKTEAILHSCPPMQLLSTGYKAVCIKPLANNPPNIILFWLHECQRLQVFSFNAIDKEMLVKGGSSDYQSIMMEVISLWINNNSGIQIATVCTHANTEELMVLDTESYLHVVNFMRSNSVCRRQLCRLDSASSEEAFRPVDMFSFKFFVGVVLHNGSINIFEFLSGMLVWKTDVLKSSGPKRLYGKGLSPMVGFWNLSGLWILKSESVLKQAEFMLNISGNKSKDRSLATKSSIRKHSRDYTAQGQKRQVINATIPSTGITLGQDDQDGTCINTNDITTYNVPFGQSDMQNSEVTHLKPDSSNICQDDLDTRLLTALDFLSRFNCKGLENRFLLQLLHSKELKDIVYKIPREAMSSISDTKLAFALFGGSDKCSSELQVRLQRQFLSQSSVDKEDNGDGNKELMKCAEQYMKLSKRQKELLTGTFKIAEGLAFDWDNSLSTKAILNVINEAPSDAYPKYVRLYKTCPKCFLLHFLYMLGIVTIVDMTNELAKIECEHSKLSSHEEISDTMRRKFWKIIISPESDLFEFVCWGLWHEMLQYLVPFVRLASKVVDDLTRKDLPSYAAKVDIINRSLTSLPSSATDLTQEQTIELADLLLLSSKEGVEVEACELYLSKRCYDQALNLLSRHADNSEKHRSLFYKILVTCYKAKDLEEVMHLLCTLVPQNFCALELCHVLLGNDSDSNSSWVFSVLERELNIGSISTIFLKLLQD